MRKRLQQIDGMVRPGDELRINDRRHALTVRGMHTRTPFEQTPEEYISELNTIELAGNGTTYHLRTTCDNLETTPVLYTESEWIKTTGDDAVGFPYTYTSNGENVTSIEFDVHDLRRVERKYPVTVETEEYTFDGVCVEREVDEAIDTDGFVSLVFEGDWWDDIQDVVDTEVLELRQQIDHKENTVGEITVLGTVFSDGDNGTIEELRELGTTNTVSIELINN